MNTNKHCFFVFRHGPVRRSSMSEDGLPKLTYLYLVIGFSICFCPPFWNVIYKSLFTNHDTLLNCQLSILPKNRDKTSKNRKNLRDSPPSIIVSPRHCREFKHVFLSKDTKKCLFRRSSFVARGSVLDFRFVYLALRFAQVLYTYAFYVFFLANPNQIV